MLREDICTEYRPGHTPPCGLALGDLLTADRLSDAFQHVASGGGAAGVDGERACANAGSDRRRWDELCRLVAAGRYQASPLRPMRTPAQGSGLGRQLLVPTVTDRVLQRAWSSGVSASCDRLLHVCSHAYRPGRDAVRAAGAVRDALSSHPWVLDADITSFFDHVDHDQLHRVLANWIVDDDVRAIAMEWVAAPAAHRQGLRARDRGLPIGAPISPLLANIYLDALDHTLASPGRVYARFADDFVVCCASEQDAHDCERQAREALAALALQLHPEKTRIVDARRESFVFLGVLLRCPATPSADQLLDRPRTRSLYVTDPGAKLLRRGSSLVVRHSGHDTVRVPLRHLRDVIVLSPCDLTSGAIAACAERGITIAVGSQFGHQGGRFEPWNSPNPALRHLQVLTALDQSTSLELARTIVCGKIVNQRRLLQRHFSRAAGPGRNGAMHSISEALSSARRAPDTPTLMGAEGSASKAFFACMGDLVAPEWGFSGRVRRPPTDPINSMLSFGYTLLFNEALSALQRSGLDSYTGFLHRPRYGSHSLALDTMEEFRPLLIDALVLAVAHRRTLGLPDFTHDPATGAVRLKPEPRKVFLREYERRMLTLFTYPLSRERVSYRRALNLQAQGLARAIQMGDNSYQPVTLA